MTQNKYYRYLKLAAKKEKVAQDVPLEEEEEGAAEGEKTKKAPAGGGGKADIPGEWIEFYNDVGDEQVQNPLTGRVIKWKTMITYRSKDKKIDEMVQDKYNKWKQDRKEKEEKEKEEEWDRDKDLEEYKKSKDEPGEVEVEDGYSISESAKGVIGELKEQGAEDLPDPDDIEDALNDPEKRKKLRDNLELQLFQKSLQKELFDKLRELLHVMGADENDLEDLLRDDPALAKGLIEKKEKEKKKEPEMLSQKKVKLAQKISSMFLSGMRPKTAKKKAPASKEKKKGKGWTKLPKGWTQESFNKFYEKITEGGKDPFYACVEKLKGKMDKPEAFCAATLDKAKGTTSWRGSGGQKKTAFEYYVKWARDLENPQKVAFFPRSKRITPLQEKSIRAFDQALSGARLGDPVSNLIGESVLGPLKRYLMLNRNPEFKRTLVYLQLRLPTNFIQDVRRELSGKTRNTREHEHAINWLGAKYRPIIFKLAEKASRAREEKGFRS